MVELWHHRGELLEELKESDTAAAKGEQLQVAELVIELSCAVLGSLLGWPRSWRHVHVTSASS